MLQGVIEEWNPLHGAVTLNSPKQPLPMQPVISASMEKGATLIISYVGFSLNGCCFRNCNNCKIASGQDLNEVVVTASVSRKKKSIGLYPFKLSEELTRSFN
jgi:hypothetical protein